jgi:hypothetical protein
MTARRVLVSGLLLVALAVFVYHARIYWSWTEDDAFITFRYAQNLVRGEGLVFNPGERVEGYSNLAWVLLAAAAIRAGQDPVTVAKILGILSGAVAILLSWLLVRRMVPQAGLTALVAVFYLAVSPVLVQHSVTGLETSFFAMVLVAAVLLASESGGRWRRMLFVLLLLLLSMTRPEGPFLALVLLVLRFVENRLQGGVLDWDAALDHPQAARAVPARNAGLTPTLLVEAAVFLLLYGAYFVWRWDYFGAPFPNTFYAKTKGGLHGLIDGAQYTLDFLRDAGGPLFVALGLVPLLVGPRRPAYWIGLGTTLAYLVFVLVSGGDWMFHYRFFAHILPVVAAVVAAGVEQVLGLPRPGTLRAVLVYATMAAVLLATTMSLGNTELKVARTVLPALGRHNYLSQNYEELGRWFHDNTPPDATVAISDVGAVGYFSERRVLDMFGLVDPHIARLHGRMHYKADPKYVLSRRPDYIVLVSLNDEGQGYSFQRIPDWGMNAQAEFHDNYELIRTEPQYWQNEFVLVYRRRAGS